MKKIILIPEKEIEKVDESLNQVDRSLENDDLEDSDVYEFSDDDEGAVLLPGNIHSKDKVDLNNH